MSTKLAKHKRIHTDEKPFLCYICGDKFISKAILNSHKEVHLNDKTFSCEICQKTYTQSSVLLLHNQSVDHLRKKETLNENTRSFVNNYVDCSEPIKVESIKEEINEEESLEDPLSIQGETTKDGSENNVEIKEEVNDDDPLCVHEIHNSRDGKNNTVVDDVDIVEHKIEI